MFCICILYFRQHQHQHTNWYTKIKFFSQFVCTWIISFLGFSFFRIFFLDIYLSSHLNTEFFFYCWMSFPCFFVWFFISSFSSLTIHSLTHLHIKFFFIFYEIKYKSWKKNTNSATIKKIFETHKTNFSTWFEAISITEALVSPTSRFFFFMKIYLTCEAKRKKRKKERRRTRIAGGKGLGIIHINEWFILISPKLDSFFYLHFIFQKVHTYNIYMNEWIDGKTCLTVFCISFSFLIHSFYVIV